MKTVRAYYSTRRGGSGCRNIRSAAEAEHILRGGYGVTNVRLEDDNGTCVGMRWEQANGQWAWFYEEDVF